MDHSKFGIKQLDFDKPFYQNKIIANEFLQSKDNNKNFYFARCQLIDLQNF